MDHDITKDLDTDVRMAKLFHGHISKLLMSLLVTAV